MSSICIFEDENFSGLLPLVWFRPVFDLRCGMSTLYEKIKRYYPRTNIYLLCRDYLAALAKKTHPGTVVGKIGKESSVLFINGRLLCDKETPRSIPLAGGDEIFEADGKIIAARLSKGNLEMIANSISAPITEKSFSAVRSTARSSHASVKLIDQFFDIIANNREQLALDINFTTRGGITRGRVHSSIALYSRGGIFIDDGAEIEAFATLDARPGPIFISRGVKVLPYSRIEGPAFIGERSVISTGSNLRSGVSMGPDCRVGGEVEDTIFQARSNKSHDGFLGNSYIAEWVNLGAGTTNSNLKNNYGNVKVTYKTTETDSGQIFLGCAVGDHTKCGIGTLINTGSIIGASSNIYGGGILPKFVPSFAWGQPGDLVKHDPEHAIKTAKAVMARRDVEMEESDIDLFRKVFELTEDERSSCGVS